MTLPTRVQTWLDQRPPLHTLWQKRWVRLTSLTLSLVLLPLVVVTSALSVFCASPQPSPLLPPPGQDVLSAQERQAVNALTDYYHGEDQSYLTFPEWYIVYNAVEYGEFIQDRPPSDFPNFRAIGQYWQSYCAVHALTRDQYPYNSEYHRMLYVIGLSFTAESIGRGLYEGTIGRVSQWLSSDHPTAEEQLAAEVAAEYGEWLHTIPFYRFPYHQKLYQLWAQTPLFGQDPLRKLERRFLLTNEYAIRGGYGGLLYAVTRIFPDHEPITIVVAENVTPDLLADFPEITLLETLDSDRTILVLPRYEPFTQLVPELLARDVRLIEVAGNHQMMVSAIAERPWQIETNEATVLFSLPVLIQDNTDRLAINVSIDQLPALLEELEEKNIELEHLYDY